MRAATPRAMRQVVLGVSLKLYLDLHETIQWSRAVAAIARRHPAVVSGAARLFALPSLPAVPAAVMEFRNSAIAVGAQDLFWKESGPYTGGVSGADLRAIGCRYVEIGHAERRSVFAEGNDVARLKLAAAFRTGLVPVLCVGESTPQDAFAAARETLEELDRVMSAVPFPDASSEDLQREGREMIVAYEPVWAIGAEKPAPVDHVRAVADALRERLMNDERITAAAVIYGGSAQPGMLADLGSSVDGLFLGRFAHDPAAMERLLDEVAGLAIHTE